MKELNDTEIQWLEAFAKNHDFFSSFLLHYNLKQHLSSNQYYWLNLYINQAIEQGEFRMTRFEIFSNFTLLRSYVNKKKMN